MHPTSLRRSALSLVLMTVSVVGCDCVTPSLRSNPGELAVLVSTSDGESARHEATFDFGVVIVDERRPLTMTLANVGSGPLDVPLPSDVVGDGLTVGRMPEGAPFAADVQVVTLEPGARLTVPLAFAPKDARAFSTTFRLAPPELEPVVVTLVGGGAMASCAVPAVIDFGAVPIGETFSLEVALPNGTTTQASVEFGALSGADRDAFGWRDGPSPGEVLVEAGEQAHATLHFSPTEARSYRARVSLRGAGACPTVQVLVKGEGGLDTLRWTPPTLDFGFVHPGETATLELSFFNPSNSPIALSNVVVAPGPFGTGAAAFSVDAPGGQFTVSGGPTPSTLQVRCTPPALGSHAASLTFDTGLARSPRGTVALRCTGGGPKLRVTPAMLAFGRVAALAGTRLTTTRRLTLENVGSRPPLASSTANLFIHRVEFLPDVGTEADEVTVTLDARYDAAVGLEATAGRNAVPVEVRLSPRGPGEKRGVVVVHSNDPAQPMARVPLTASAVDAPPCNLRVTPGSLDFGLVASGQKDLSFTLENLGTGPDDVCFLTNLALEASSQPAFSLVGGPLPEKELLPHETLQVTVRVQGPFVPTTTLIAALGGVSFDVSSIQAPHQRVLLRALLGTGCLVALPDPLDFGVVALGCQSAPRSVQLYNACSTPIQVTRLELGAAGGQPAGGPACPGATACPEFSLSAVPLVPGGGLTLTQGAAPVSLSAIYRPIDLGADTGLVLISFVQSGQPVVATVQLQARATADGRQEDVFQLLGQPKADVLFVVDDSGSMGDKLQALANNFSTFSALATTSNVDSHFAVTTTSASNTSCTSGTCTPVSSVAAGGWFYRNPGANIPAVTTTQNAWAFSAAVSALGTGGLGIETPLETAVLALTPPLITGANAGFLRADANLGVVVVSDAGDQSPNPVSYYLSRLVGVKGARGATALTFSVVGPFGSETSTCLFDSSHDPSRFEPLLQATGGASANICAPDWVATLESVGRKALGLHSRFTLTQSPDLSNGQQLEVRVDGVVVTGWTWDGATNSISFPMGSAPMAGQTVTVGYLGLCQ